MTKARRWWNGGRALADDDNALALLGAVLRVAVQDAQQTTDAKLRADAWDFLRCCAPDVAQRLEALEQEPAHGTLVTGG